MTRIMVMTTTSLANVKARLSAFVDSVHDTHERVTITRNGEPAAVLISPDDLESLEETIAILSDPQAMADIRESDATAVLEFIRGPLASEPFRVGKPLRNELAGKWVARRGEYRIVYTINERMVKVTVVQVSHRRDAYR